MSKTCILTDSTAQFPSPAFEGRKRVNIIPLKVQIDGSFYENGDGLKATDLPVSANQQQSLEAHAPSVDEFEATFNRLGQWYSDIIAILHSSYLSETMANAQAAAALAQGHVNIHVIDSQTTAIGLGLLVQAAAEAAERGTHAEEIEYATRSLIPRIYTLFCIEGLTYLENSGYLGPAQALVGEYLKVMPIFVLEYGMLVPTQKARNYRHLVDIMHEFLCEFEQLEHIAILQGAPAFENETRALRERIADGFGDTPLSEHTIGATLATMIGPRSLGLFALQPEN